MNKYFILLMFMLTPLLYCQQFKLSDINSTEYSIDKIAQQVYFRGTFTDTVEKVDLRDMSVKTVAQHSSLPFFANKHHFMLWGNNSYWGDPGDSSKDNIYLYNLDNNSYFQITDTLAFPYNSEYYGSFSPNDSNFLYPGFCFTLKDSSLIPFYHNYIDYNINDAWPQWSSDTSFVFFTGSNPDSVVAEYFLKFGKLDTLLMVHGYISGFSYNRKNKILAYAFGSPCQLYFHYINKNIPDSSIFENENQLGGPDFSSLRWSPDDSKLAFVCTRIDMGSEIYVYDSDSKKTYSGGGGGYIDHIKWANNDTLIFVNESNYLLYGLDVSSITSVKESKIKSIPSKFTISNYPNPFNPGTNFYINIPAKQSFIIKIYDVLGKLVKTIRVNAQSTEVNNISWDGRNNSGQLVSSGIYFATAIVNNAIHSNTIKLILLK